MQKFWQVTRSAYIWTAIGLGTALMYFAALPVFILTAPFDPKRRFGHWYAQRWGRMILRLNNRWSHSVYRAERIPKDRPLVVISNHQGMGDIMMAFCLDLHFKWISKRSNFFVPFMGWFMFHAGYIPLKRGQKSSIEKCMARAREYLEMGVSVLFFPEGTRSKDGVVQPFKKGAFQLALDGGFDILPMAISGTLDALPKGTWLFSDDYAHMRLLVGEPISTKGLTDKDLDALIARGREAVIALKDELDGRVAAEAAAA
jgi:1-acyl-sn-glycerol-3-phosphate acyltransferase